MGDLWRKIWARLNQTSTRVWAWLYQVWNWLAEISHRSWAWLTQFCRRIWAWSGQNSAQLRLLCNLALIAGMIFIIVGLQSMHQQLQFAGEQIRTAVNQTQAAAAHEITKVNRELTAKIWDDPKLRPILDPSTKNTDPKKVEGFIFILIQHYATAFRQWKQGNIAQENWEELATDAQQLFKSPEIRRRWLKIRDLYKKDFQEFVEKTPLG